MGLAEGEGLWGEPPPLVKGVPVCACVCICVCTCVELCVYIFAEGPAGGCECPSQRHTMGLPMGTWDVDLVSTLAPAEPVCPVLLPGKVLRRRCEL